MNPNEHVRLGVKSVSLVRTAFSNLTPIIVNLLAVLTLREKN